MSKSVKAVLDNLFKDIEFDEILYKKLLINNIEFITKDSEFKHLFGSKLIGCFYIKYTQYHKNIFYNNLFDMEYEDIVDAIDEITTINKSYKIARDDVNLVSFYIAHRFLSNKKLDKKHSIEYAKEALNYFNYRTLVLISSSYWVYPISEEKAMSLMERLSNKYLIKKLKNWNEYCNYRSEEYITSKYGDFLHKLTDDAALPNAVTDLFNRTKDTLKHMYREFVALLEDDDIITRKKSTVKDIEGQEVILDKLNTPESYILKVESRLSDKRVFINTEYMKVTIDIINSISLKSLEEALTFIFEYNFKNRECNLEVNNFVSNVMTSAIHYLNSNDIYLHKKTNVVLAISKITGGVLYSRGSESEVYRVKEEGDNLLRKVYKEHNKSISDRNLYNLRNAIYIYIVLSAIV